MNSNWTPASALWDLEHGTPGSPRLRSAIDYLASLSQDSEPASGLLALACKLRGLSTWLAGTESTDEDPSTAEWFAESKRLGCTGVSFNAKDDTISHEGAPPCPVHSGA